MNDCLIEKLIRTIKKINNISDDDFSKDELINIAIQSVISYVKKYCNLDYITEDMYYLILDMVKYKYYSIDSSTVSGDIKEMVVGDTKIVYGGQSTTMTDIQLYKNFEDYLKLYVKVKPLTRLM